LLAGINVLTEKAATISGVAFTVVFFTAFTLSEKYYETRRRVSQKRPRSIIREGEMEKFRLEVRENLSPQSLKVRPGNVLVAVYDPYSLHHLQTVLDETDPKAVDVVVLSVNSKVSDENQELAKEAEKVVDNYEMLVFSRVVHLAEKVGKQVRLVAVAGKDPYSMIFQAAQRLRSSRVVIGASSMTSANEQKQDIRQAWERLPTQRPTVKLEIVGEADQKRIQIDLGLSLC
jgi:hypothetical protein